MEFNDNVKNIKFESEKVKDDTIYFINGIVKEFKLYPEIMNALANGKASIELKKRIMLRAIDEAWVRAIEDTIPSLDAIIRKPTRFIDEEELVLPMELTRSISSRSIQHLSQHTDYISEVNADDEIIPSKLLNVFREETIQTYENKFINTLISRLFAFVHHRYDSALSSGQDVKNTSFEFKNDFTHGDVHGKIHIRLEVEEPPKDGEVEKNYVFVSDLWKRVERLNLVVGDYMQSSFVKQMGNSFIRPPVMRTNAILKNKDFRQCLALWDFISTYENAGFSTMVEDTLLDLSEEKIREFYSLAAVEYLVFRNHIDKGFNEGDELDKYETEVPLSPEIIEDLKPATAKDFAIHIAKIDQEMAVRTVEESEILRAIEVALLADELLQNREMIEDGDGSKDMYSRSFMARFILAQEPCQTLYTELKNFILSYKKVHGRLSWKHENFNIGRNMIASLQIRGKTLVIYLPLDPKKEEYQLYHVLDMSEYQKYEKLPLALKIRSRRALGYAMKLLKEVFDNLGVEQNLIQDTVDYHLPYETKSALLGRGLIKMKKGAYFDGLNVSLDNAKPQDENPDYNQDANNT